MDRRNHGGNNIDDSDSAISKLLTASLNNNHNHHSNSSTRKITQSPLPQDVAMANNDSTSQTSQLSDSGDDESRALLFTRKSTPQDSFDARDTDSKRHSSRHPIVRRDQSSLHHDVQHRSQKGNHHRNHKHHTSSSHKKYHHDYDRRKNDTSSHSRKNDNNITDLPSEQGTAECGLNYNSETSLGHQSDHASIAVHAPESVAGDVEDSRSLCSISHHHPDDQNVSTGYQSGGAFSDDISQPSSANNYRLASTATGILRSSVRSNGSTGSGSVAGKDAHSNHTSLGETQRAGGSQGSIGTVSDFALVDKFGIHTHSSFDGPPGRVMVSHHTQHPVSLGGLAPMIVEESRFLTNASYAASEAVKSDIATVCSGSVIEDIELSSVTSVDLGMPQHTTTTLQQTNLLYSSHTEKNSGRKNSQSGSKVERGVEFANGPSILSSHTTANNQQAASSRTSPVPEIVPSLTSAGIVLNDMGPPLSRTLLLERAGTVPNGSTSRPGSVRSFGSQAPSDVVAHVDTDDCGGSLLENESRASIHSQEDIRSIHSQEGCESEITTKPAACTMTHNYNNMEGEISNDPVQYLSNNPLHNSQPDNLTNGRTSPGGTVYKGRGVRRYQGRYMNLPLQRFHQDGAILPPPVDDSSTFHGTENFRTSPEVEHRPQHTDSFSRYEVENKNSHKRWSHSSRSWSHNRSRSRSRSRSRDRKNTSSGGRNRSWSRSPSPHLSRNQTHNLNHDGRSRESRSNNHRKTHASNNSGRWRNNQRGGKNNRRENSYPSRSRNGNNRRGEGSNYYQRGGYGGGHHSNGRKRSESPPNGSMPPRDPKHFKDTHRKKSTSRSKS